MGENIGAAARAMRNFGFEQLRLICPRDGGISQTARAMASGGGRLLDEAQIFGSLSQALNDIQFSVALTARPRRLNKTVYDIDHMAKNLHEKQAKHQKVAIIFGPENAGLNNDEIAKANAIATIDTDPTYASLNLAQSVVIVCHALKMNTQAIAVKPKPRDLTATATEIEKLDKRYREFLAEMNFFYPKAKASLMQRNLTNMWTRLGLTHAEVRLFHGILQKLEQYKNH